MELSQLSKRDEIDLLNYLIIFSILDEDHDELEDLLVVKMFHYRRKSRAGRSRYIPVSSPMYRGVMDSDLRRGLECEQFYRTFLHMKKETFEKLLRVFECTYINTNVTNKGCLEQSSRPPRATKNAKDALAMFLFWFNNVALVKTCSLIFGIHTRKVYRIILHARLVLIRVLKDHSEAKVSFPNESKRKFLADWAEQKYPGLAGEERIWGFIDDCKLRVKRSGNFNIQNCNYNGWLHSQVVNNVLVYDVFGRVCWHSLNLKGNTHDSTACIPLYDFLIREQPLEKILADSAFSNQVGMFPLNKTNLRNTLNGYSLVSMRQSVEHAMREFQKPGTLKLPLDENETKRRQLLHLSVLLGNFTTVNERNHISSTYVANVSDVYLTAALATIKQNNEDASVDNNRPEESMPSLELMLHNECLRRNITEDPPHLPLPPDLTPDF